MRGTKRALARSAAASLEEQLDFEAEQQAICYESADLAEGLRAAREKRPPRFEGRLIHVQRLKPGRVSVE